jgi:hypothetical protein
MTFEARCGSFQSSGLSASWFSSARRALDASKSKMPPQQPDRPLDVLDDGFSFCAHFLYREMSAAFNEGPAATQPVLVNPSKEACV